MRNLRSDNISEYVRQGIWNKDWYAVNRQAIETIFPGENHNLICDLLAITSMNSTLKSNVANFLKAYYQYKNNLPFSGMLPNIILHLEYHRQGDSFGGRKVANFAKALKGDQSAVVVDLWMLRAFGIYDQNSTPSKIEYDWIEHFIFTHCLKFGLTPRQMQAAIWTGIRSRYSNSDEPTKYCDVLRSKIKTCLFVNGEGRIYTKKFIYVSHG